MLMEQESHGNLCEFANCDAHTFAAMRRCDRSQRLSSRTFEEATEKLLTARLNAIFRQPPSNRKTVYCTDFLAETAFRIEIRQNQPNRLTIVDPQI